MYTIDQGFLINKPEDFNLAEKLILPGVGAFDYAVEMLNSKGIRDDLDFRALQEKKPILGVCVGMQMMARSSEEGEAKGLGWIDGSVMLLKKFQAKQEVRVSQLYQMLRTISEQKNMSATHKMVQTQLMPTLRILR